jgi:hypothetical protein
VSVWSPSILMYEALLSSSSYLFVVCMCVCLRESGGENERGERATQDDEKIRCIREGFGGGLMNVCTYDERCPFAQQHLRSECCHFSLICEREVCSLGRHSSADVSTMNVHCAGDFIYILLLLNGAPQGVRTCVQSNKSLNE